MSKTINWKFLRTRQSFNHRGGMKYFCKHLQTRTQVENTLSHRGDVGGFEHSCFPKHLHSYHYFSNNCFWYLRFNRCYDSRFCYIETCIADLEEHYNRKSALLSRFLLNSLARTRPSLFLWHSGPPSASCSSMLNNYPSERGARVPRKSLDVRSRTHGRDWG